MVIRGRQTSEERRRCRGCVFLGFFAKETSHRGTREDLKTVASRSVVVQYYHRSINGNPLRAGKKENKYRPCCEPRPLFNVTRQALSRSTPMSYPDSSENSHSHMCDSQTSVEVRRITKRKYADQFFNIMPDGVSYPTIIIRFVVNSWRQYL